MVVFYKILKKYNEIQLTKNSDTAHEGGGCDQSIGSIVPDAIVRSWLWSTATESTPLGYFRRLLQIAHN